jgi:hypothetical protein
MAGHTLRLLPGRFAICRLDPEAPVPPWAEGGALTSVTRTSEELAVICGDARVPAGTECERGWRGMQVEGPFDFETVGVLASLAAPLAEAGVPILCVSTYDTDYLLVREGNLDRAVEALAGAGHRMVEAP